MQWAYYWYYSALGCHGHLVRHIQFSLFHHHYPWGHLLWKMNSASFAWLISNFFFYLFNRRSYAGDLELVKKKKRKKASGGWVGARSGMCVEVKQIPQALPPASRCICHSCPATFSPWARTGRAAAVCAEPESLTRAWCVSFTFLFSGLWALMSIFTEDRQQPPCSSVGSAPRPPSWWGSRLSSLWVFFWAAQSPQLSVSPSRRLWSCCEVCGRR